MSETRRPDDSLPDAEARRHAVSPAENVVLEASAGTGKTRVLVDRYVNLLLAGVDPENILAITFTRKAAAEMRQRIIERLRQASLASQLDAARWRDLRERLGDIAISTIDAFCLSLLREFPLEADVDPGFDVASDTEVPRLIDEALDQTLRMCRARVNEDDDLSLVFAQLGERRLRTGLAALLDRRLVAPDILRRYLQNGPRDLTAADACRSAAERLREAVARASDGLERFLEYGPMGHPQFAMLAGDLARLCDRTADAALETRAGQAAFRALVDHLGGYFFTQSGEPRKKGFAGTGFGAEHCVSPDAWKRHREMAADIAPAVADAVRAFRRDLNVLLSRGVWRIFSIALSRYHGTLEAHALLDFPGVLEHALALLTQMDEFARSRYRLEARYHHVLVDEFQDTSRAQWELVAQLVRSWGEGLGASADALPPSIFIVGDRKQSIYGFRDAEVAMLDEATTFIQMLRPDGQPRQAISVSFRSAPGLLAFVNDLFDAIVEGASGSPGKQAFRYADDDHFPVLAVAQDVTHADDEPLGIVTGATVRDEADAVAGEIVGLLAGATVRDRVTGVRRPAQPADIAILFRSRASHREFEVALQRRGVSTYVYKGLGFFEADEIQDVVSLLRCLADPASDLRAAAFLRSRIVRVSDEAIERLAPGIAAALFANDRPDAFSRLGEEDRLVFAGIRASVSRWREWVDRVTPAELLDAVLQETAYAYELRGPRRLQARENLKKLRGLVRRIQNRGYATLQRIADHLDHLAVGDESNAAIDAVDAVSLMTVHAAKGLEFPIVFIVNLGRGTGSAAAPIRVTTDDNGEASVAIADYQSEADEEAQPRDREETKRLLYVALTRACDRLYLSATVQDGVCRTRRGGLGEVLPRSLVAVIAAAAAEAASAEGRPVRVWTAQEGRAHAFVVCRAAKNAQATLRAAKVEPATPPADDFGAIGGPPVVARVPVRLSVAANAQPSGDSGDAVGTPGPVEPVTDDDAAIAGTLAHQLFRCAADTDPADLRGRARQWLAEAGALSRLADHGAIDTLIDRAVRWSERFQRDARIVGPLSTGRAFYEVPFAFRLDDKTIVRGSIDCLIKGLDGRITVVELKTGLRLPEHERQLEVYVEAARVLFPDAPVDGLLVYADGL